MQIKLIDNPVKLAEFLNNPDNTGNIIDSGDTYPIRPDALYLGIYEGVLLVGVHEVRNFWYTVVECHAVYEPGFRGEYALNGHRLFCKWLLENSPFTNSITTVPDSTKYGRALIRLLGATRIGHMDDAYLKKGKPSGVTLYQLTRSQYEELLNANFSNRE
ncbi:DUF2824 family protein [Salmonella enterica subsp. diarizonae]|uniref:DUF2824 family protein n=1 Tax=Salmonella newport TaxID=108619 RepID=A0A5Y2FEK3_SALNE|nr:DUF2824 family protein [Salmonella enterica subsp. enterica serovar Newport]EAY1188101.1 DUF2824 family protein [Salmonella enterica]ECC9192409.1 DUF2824 family protein [Salmonella enterica subsp. diarizonae]ECD9440571.1 DUF2824 family protein [Salmonella enterica subsp. salamae]EDU6311143.1 DUF2824 family protein [Salmonella enterica subsp. diarizonae serovar 53:z10:z]EGL0767452.1 DUF2824 family protein [Salmonella enterica subsp. enterica]EHG9036288.1 DUF2824 family protein [Salmonella e